MAEDEVSHPNDTYEYGDILTDGFSRFLVNEENEFEYLINPLIAGISTISSIIISCVFLKKSMVSPTTILLVGIALSRSLRFVCESGTHIYSHFAYSSDDIYVSPYPFCIVRFLMKRVISICEDFAHCLVFYVALQRLLVVKWPFKSRIFLTNRVSLLVLLTSGIISIGYNLPDFVATGTQFTTFKAYVEGKGLDVDNYISHEYYYYYYYYYYYDDETESSVTTENVMYDITTNAMYDITTNVMYDITTIPAIYSSTSGNGTVSHSLHSPAPMSQSYENEESWISDAQKEALYNECIYKQDTDVGHASRLYTVIFYIVYLFSIATFTILLIFFMRNRGLSDSRHEAKSRVKKMLTLNISVVLLLIMELVRGALSNSLLFITYLVYVGVYQLPSTREGLENFILAARIRDVIVALSSFISLWIYVVSCSQFRQEIMKLFICASCRTKRKPTVLSKQAKSS